MSKITKEDETKKGMPAPQHRFKPYTCCDLLDYLDVINCIEDVSVIADYLAENLSDYSLGEQIMLERLIFMYAEIFTL